MIAICPNTRGRFLRLAELERSRPVRRHASRQPSIGLSSRVNSGSRARLVFVEEINASGLPPRGGSRIRLHFSRSSGGSSEGETPAALGKKREGRRRRNLETHHECLRACHFQNHRAIRSRRYPVAQVLDERPGKKPDHRQGIPGHQLRAAWDARIQQPLLGDVQAGPKNSAAT